MFDNSGFLFQWCNLMNLTLLYSAVYSYDFVYSNSIACLNLAPYNFSQQEP